MRLFVAIELDDGAREAFAVEQARLRAAVGENGGPTWIPPHRLHLTLAFLGEVAEPRASEVVRIIARPISAAPFTLAFGGLGVFPPRGAPRVIWVASTTGSEEAVILERTMAERLESVGLMLETRQFRPHVTLGRWRGGRPADARRLRATDRGLEIARVVVDHVTLFESRLSTRGARYTPLARATLSGAGPPLVQ